MRLSAHQHTVPLSTENRYNILREADESIPASAVVRAAYTNSLRGTDEATVTVAAAVPRAHASNAGPDGGAQPAQTQRERRPPAINVTGSSYHAIRNALVGSDIPVEWQITPKQIRVFPNTEENRQRIIQILKVKGFQFYSHLPRSEPKLCTVLKGVYGGPDAAQCIAAALESDFKCTRNSTVRSGFFQAKSNP